jgi:rhodanese-related sulfurtransferase/DNA-directed RNA polymerase subunit RPC12/RpoP
MRTGNVKSFLLHCIFLFVVCISLTAARRTADQYKCLPCGQQCDNATYDKPGKCSHCTMDLVKASTIVFKTIQPSAICNYIQKHPGVVLLDVRTKEEFEGRADPNFGSLKNAINISIQDLEQKLPSIANLKNKEIIVYCSHSHRSPRASYLLTQNGFTNVTNMAGGMSVMKDNACKK